MKTRKVTFTLNVPAWVPQQHELKRWYKTVRFFFLPFRCRVTGKRLDFKNAQYEYNHGGGRVMISSWDGPLCREERIKLIEKHFVSPEMQQGYQYDIQVRKCDSCGHVKPTIGGSPKMSFGMAWWNGFHLCQLCITETIRLGKEKSSVFAFHNGESVCVNEAGVYIYPVTPQGTTKVEICSEKSESTW